MKTESDNPEQRKEKSSMIPSSGEHTFRGTVKWFSAKKGFGFIEAEDGEEVFVHFSSITGKGYRVLQEGDLVSFEKVPGPKGHQAFHVVVQKPQ